MHIILIHLYIIFFFSYIFSIIFMSSEYCPKCRYCSLRVIKGYIKCSEPKCTYVQFHPISYQNDVKNFQGQTTNLARCSMPYNPDLPNGGLDLEFEGTQAQSYNTLLNTKQDKYARDYKQAQRTVDKLAESLKIVTNIRELAMIRFSQIYKICENIKSTVSKKNLAIYALYMAAFQEQRFCIQQRLIKRADLQFDNWKQIKRQITNDLSSDTTATLPIPKQTAYHHAMRICKKLNIDQVQKQAITKLIENFREYEVQSGEKDSTVAACAVWLICRKSPKYEKKDDFQLANIAKTSEGRSQAAVKKFYEKNIQKEQTKLIPKFEGSL